ncbi:dihydrodipicolinate synthase family protein [Actinocrinis sp.]|uniref:dihydrodipicolinate synthase family protein n=1 Tax=Actinocrinis sp. TaxID=1920516 RepID=UPI002D01BD7C|nr:dihydrodipicolinate synthase family protein [Actinocrinis sp.]HXR69734.1 dihydrodipicolinate synthase family protein [Actinocrinis sp.]
MSVVCLPRADGTWREHRLGGAPAWRRPSEPIGSRVAFAAAHVVADRFGENVPGARAAVDWETTLAFRRHLFSWGLGVAEAMDTAQRGMGMDWPATEELIRRSTAQAKQVGGRIAAGAGTDHLPAAAADLGTVLHGYEEQLAVVEDAGAQPILMASRQLAAAAKGPDDYLAVYSRLLEQASRPVILHWLGAAFDPALGGYWGSTDVPSATATVLDLIKQHSEKVDGIKVSLLDADHEKRLRADLPAGVRLYTGDDFHYPELIRGDGTHHSDALLGVFAAIPQAASAALQALDRGDHAAYDAAFAPTLELARHLFAAPTYYYKTGIAFLAWLNDLQPAFTMVGGLHSARSAVHLAEVFRLADRAGALADPEQAADRLRVFLATSMGVIA